MSDESAPQPSNWDRDLAAYKREIRIHGTPPKKDLLGRLRAALDETERIALRASGSKWIDEIGDVREAGNGNWVANAGVRDRQHVVHNDPDSVLRQVAAHRKILAAHEPHPWTQRMARGEIVVCNSCGSVDDSPTEWPCETLLALAEAYEIEVEP